MRVALVSCTKLKKSYPCSAEEMYLPSPLFRKTREYVLRNDFSAWFILSAKYGLLMPLDVISPYNITLNDMKKDDIIRWAERVNGQFISCYTDVFFFTGKIYRKFLIPLFELRNIRCEVPLEGMGIGQQLKFYNENI
jgi:hypothetical protein